MFGAFQPGGGERGDKAARHLVERGATLLDVRTREEFSQKHLDRATNIPVQELAQRLTEIAPGHPVVVYCASGGRSARAASILRAAGFAHVHDVGAMHAY